MSFSPDKQSFKKRMIQQKIPSFWNLDIPKTYITMTVEELKQKKQLGIINDGFNRPSTVSDDGNAKNVGIIESILKGTLCTSIILRDIKKNKKLKNRYGDVTEYIIVDGGHRIRAIDWFTSNKFQVFGYYFKDMPAKYREKLLQYKIAITLVICNSLQTQAIFTDVNKVKAVKPYSVIMVNEESQICKLVRQQTKNWSVYGSECHSLFRLEDGKALCFTNFDTPNSDNIWDTLIFTTIHKIIGGGNVDSGEKTTYKLLEKENNEKYFLPNNIIEEMKKFLNFAKSIYDITSKRFSINSFGALQIVYFDLYKKTNGKFKIVDAEKFHDSFYEAWIELTSKGNKETFLVDDERILVSNFIKTNSIAFSKPDEQNKIAEFFQKKMGSFQDCGVIVLAARRSRTSEEKQELALKTKNRCYIDYHYSGNCPQKGKRLKINEMVYSHVVSHSSGGDEGVIMCAHCNAKQGTLSLKDFVKTFN